MSNNQNTNDEEIIDGKINDLIKKAEALNEQIDKSSKESDTFINEVNKNVDKNIDEIEKDLSHLDKAEKETEEEMEDLMLKRAEEISKDDEEE